ncbi:MAG: glycoside hydrolase family 73 protein [Saprospiraceae bacterium]|jgi:flagellum-specific peptidoglycan hydrolase FlgJ
MNKGILITVSVAIFFLYGSWTISPLESPYLPSAKVDQYINQHKYLAAKLKATSGIPMSIILGLAGLESNWGTSELARRSNNHFGIKKGAYWQGPVYCKDTEEYPDGRTSTRMVQCFRKYSYISDSYRDFGQHLTKDRYKGLYNHSPSRYRYWAYTLQDAGYATDPKYAEKLIHIIEHYQLHTLDRQMER